jgi:hypothetical protein
MKKLIPEKHVGKLRAAWAFAHWWFTSAGQVLAFTFVFVAVLAALPLAGGAEAVTLTMADFQTASGFAVFYWVLLFGWRLYRHPEDSIFRRVGYLWRGWGCMTTVTWGTDDARERVQAAIAATDQP